jgi:5-methylcytosine-specific restriction endonuclease McrA
MKVCKACGESKAFTEFGKEPRVADGLQARCRLCKNKSGKIWASQNKDKLNLMQNNYRKANPEKMAIYQQRYKATKREYTKQWYQENKEKYRGYVRARRAKIRENDFVKYSEWEVIAEYGSKCHLCNMEIDMLASRATGSSGWEESLHIDHVMPISKGGADSLENVRPAHGLCNLMKGASEIDFISR